MTDEIDEETGDRVLEFVIANNEAHDLLKPLLESGKATTTLKSSFRADNAIGECIEVLNDKYNTLF